LDKETSLQNGERSSRQKAQKGCFSRQIAKRIQSGYERHQLPLQFPRAFAVPTYSLGAAANAISLSVRAHSPPDRRGRRIEKIGSLRLWPRPLRQPPRAFAVPTYSLGAAGGRYCFLSGAQPTGQAGKKNREDGQLSAPVPASAPISAHVIGPADPLRAKTVAGMLPVRVRRSSGRETESGNREGGQLQSCPPS